MSQANKSNNIREFRVIPKAAKLKACFDGQGRAADLPHLSHPLPLTASQHAASMQEAISHQPLVTPSLDRPGV
jgi:hypothetical protein|eukprot:COSAG01_NODE_648_length_14530_cov_206.392281_4_plen_73_part_00